MDALRTTVSDTLPSTIRATPDRPWLPTPIRELPRSRAWLTSTDAALKPWSGTASTWTPRSRTASRSDARSAIARRKRPGRPRRTSLTGGITRASSTDASIAAGAVGADHDRRPVRQHPPPIDLGADENERAPRLPDDGLCDAPEHGGAQRPAAVRCHADKGAGLSRGLDDRLHRAVVGDDPGLDGAVEERDVSVEIAAHRRVASVRPPCGDQDERCTRPSGKLHTGLDRGLGDPRAVERYAHPLDHRPFYDRTGAPTTSHPVLESVREAVGEPRRHQLEARLLEGLGGGAEIRGPHPPAVGGPRATREQRSGYLGDEPACVRPAPPALSRRTGCSTRSRASVCCGLRASRVTRSRSAAWSTKAAKEGPFISSCGSNGRNSGPPGACSSTTLQGKSRQTFGSSSRVARWARAGVGGRRES